jgi:retron-type reverse transcriptase
LVLEIIEPEVSTWSRSGDLLAIWGEIDVLCAKPCRASQRGLVSGKVGVEAFHTESRGKMRPLGIPATEDKLLQTVVAKILEAIYEPIFMAGSFGYRPNRGGLDAIKDVSVKLQFGGFNYIVEADIRGFFDAIDHTLLIEMLKKKIDDKAFLGLIRKWLKAGVLEDGKVIDPVTGTPQGGTVSPIFSQYLFTLCLG